jgi:2-iminobutanoate/2-iminopropanoate deaminase
MRRKIYTDYCPAPIGYYSQGIACTGEFVYVSGQLPIDASTGQLVANNITDQTHQSLLNIGYVLTAGGFTWADVVKCNVYLKTMDDFAGMNEVYKTFVVEDYPARVAFQVGKLPMDALVEIEAIAVR